MVDLNKSLLPGDGWVRRWTEEQPSVIVDVLDQVDPSAISLAQSALKSSGISYYVLITSGANSTLDCVYPWTALGPLKEAIIDSAMSFYKDKAKRYRKWVALKQSRFPYGFGSMVRYNVKAGWMEELAMDLPAAVRAYHVAYSALVEAAKQSPEKTIFISSIRSVSDYLARKIVCGLARSGSAQEADAYLRNHHGWSGASETDQLANVLAVAESFVHPTDPTSPLIPGHYYLQAINLARSMGNLDLAHLRSMLTLAFDSYKASGRGAKRHLIYISLLSADLFEHGQNMEMLSQAVRDEKWDRMAALMLRGLSGISVQSAWFGLAHTLHGLDEEGLNGLLENGSGTVQFSLVQDTCHLPCAMRFLHKQDGTLHVQVALCNMSPIAISLETVVLAFKEEGEEITIHAAEEIIPGATYSVTQSIDGPDRVLRLAQVRLQCGSLLFSYSASSLCTVETLYLLPVTEVERWNVGFLRSLGGYWARSKMNVPRPKEVPSFPQVTCSANSTLATRVPVKFTFEGPAESLRILGCDHGTFDTAPFRVDDGPIEITWNVPGTKSIHFEARSDAGEMRTFCQQFQVTDPFKFVFNLIRSSPEVALLNVDLTVQIDGISLTKWDLLDSSSGTILNAINPITSKGAYMTGDLLRAGFILPDTPETNGDLVFRVGWTTDTIAQCTTSEQCPSHLLATRSDLMLGTEASALKAPVGDRISLRWTLISHLDVPSIPLTMTITDRPADPDFEDSWVYEGPCVVDVGVEPGQRYTVEAWVTGLRPGRFALPIVTVTPTNPAHAMHPITAIQHPTILITN